MATLRSSPDEIGELSQAMHDQSRKLSDSGVQVSRDAHNIELRVPLALLGVFALPPVPGWYVDAPLWLAGLQAAAFVAILSWAGWWLDRRGWYVSL